MAVFWRIRSSTRSTWAASPSTVTSGLRAELRDEAGAPIAQAPLRVLSVQSTTAGCCRNDRHAANCFPCVVQALLPDAGRGASMAVCDDERDVWSRASSRIPPHRRIDAHRRASIDHHVAGERPRGRRGVAAMVEERRGHLGRARLRPCRQPRHMRTIESPVRHGDVEVARHGPRQAPRISYFAHVWHPESPQATAEKKAAAGEMVTGSGGQAAIAMVKLLVIAKGLIVDNVART